MAEVSQTGTTEGAGGAATVSHFTSWTLIEHAADGSAAAREEFCRRYLPVVRAYLTSRWRGRPSARHLDDAEQEVFLRCLQEGGLLERADPRKGGGFQGFLYGLTRNVAREHEARDARSPTPPDPSPIDDGRLAADEGGLSRLFDRAFARTVMREAGELLRARAQVAGEAARRRVELLSLRFEGGLPIRTIAKSLDDDAARLHHEYARARREFETALLDTAAEHLPGRSPGEVRAYCEELLELLG